VRWRALAEFRGVFSNFISNTITSPRSHFTPQTMVPSKWFIAWWSCRTRRQRHSHGSIWVRILHRPADSKRRWVQRRRCVHHRYAAKPTWGRIQEPVIHVHTGLGAGQLVLVVGAVVVVVVGAVDNLLIMISLNGNTVALELSYIDCCGYVDMLLATGRWGCPPSYSSSPS
jgi:hypothetical protein